MACSQHVVKSLTISHFLPFRKFYVDCMFQHYLNKKNIINVQILFHYFPSVFVHLCGLTGLTHLICLSLYLMLNGNQCVTCFLTAVQCLFESNQLAQLHYRLLYELLLYESLSFRVNFHSVYIALQTWHPLYTVVVPCEMAALVYLLCKRTRS